MTFSDSAAQGNSLLGQSSSLFSPRVLLVEDSPIDVRLVQLMLRKAEFLLSGVDLVAVGTLEEALACVRRQRFDVTLLDLSLPDSSGLSTLRQLQSVQPTIPVVVLTSSTEPSDLLRAYDAGTNAYIAKPTEFSQFLSAMKHVCEFWININQTAPQLPSAGVRTTGFGDLI